MVEEAKKKALAQLNIVQIAAGVDWPAADICKGAFGEIVDDLISAVREGELRRATKPDIIDTLKTSRY